MYEFFYIHTCYMFSLATVYCMSTIFLAHLDFLLNTIELGRGVGLIHNKTVNVIKDQNKLSESVKINI